MPRKQRIQYPGAWYHVMNRGGAHQNIFRSNTHYELFTSLLSDAHEKYQAEIHAYCLMSNHYHLLLHCPNENLSKIMQYISKIYTQRFNKIHAIDGSLFRGRFKSIPVDADNYLLQVSRYMHLNPVAANITRKPEDYPWSSYKYYLNSDNNIKWLFHNEILNRFENTHPIQAYKQFVMAGIHQEDTINISKMLSYKLCFPARHLDEGQII